MPYDPSWNRPHRPSDHETWQESDAYWFYDAKADVGGWHRIGHYPATGSSHDCSFVFAEGGDRVLSLTPAEGAAVKISDDGQAIGSSYARHLGGERMGFGWANAEAEASLEFYEAFYTPRNWHAEAEDASYSDKVNKAGGHLEVAGRLRGPIRIGKTDYEIDALAHRDRSWGERNLREFSALWFSNGTVGPELSWASMMVRMTGGAVMKMGYVVRDGVSTDIVDIRTSVALADDGLSSMGASFRLITPDEELVVPMKPRQGFMQTFLPAMIVTDHCSSVKIEGRTGFCDLAVVANPFRGSAIPSQQDVGAICISEGRSACVTWREL